MEGPQLDADQTLARLRAGNRRFVDHVVRAAKPCSATPGARTVRARNGRSRRSWAVAIRARRPSSCLTRDSATCSSSASPATSPRPRRSVASSSRPCASASVSSWHSATATAARSRRRSKPPTIRMKCRRRCTRSSIGSCPHWATSPTGMRMTMRTTRDAVRANVCFTTARLRADSTYLDRMCHEQGLSIVGADYDLSSGVVDFFHAVQ